MDISRRIQSLKPAATLAVTARAAALRQRGVDVLSFAAGEPDFDTPEPIKRALIDSLNRGETKYAPVPGDAETRRIIAEKLARENGIPNVSADHVVISSGGKQSLCLLFQALIDPPECGEDSPTPKRNRRHAEVILPTPAWVSYAPQIRLAGGRVVEVPLSAAGGFRMTPEQLRQAITPRTRAIVINSPSNPCGTMYSPDELRALAAVVAEAARSTAPDLVVISDELYEKIVFGGIPHFSIGSVPEIAERVVTVNGLSKAYAMTGWRVGYLAGSGEFGLKAACGVAALQSQSTTSIVTFALPAIRVALTECAGEVERMRQAFARRAGITHDLMSGVPGFLCPRPMGAFYVFPDISAHFGKRTPAGRTIHASSDFAAALLDEKHVAVIPGEDFGTGGERCIRFTFACGDEDIREGIARIHAFVESLK